jgi:hypothetical protein
MPKSIDRAISDRRRLAWLRSRVAASILALLAVIACNGTDPSAQPIIASFTADPGQIEQGDTSTLAWSVSGASTLTLLPDGIDVTGRTSWTVAPSVSTTYTLLATNGVGERDASTTVIVGDLPVIESFAPVAEPGREFTLVNPGVPVTLAWAVVDADSVTIEGPGLPEQSVELVGSMDVTPPTVAATYTLRATNEAGPIEASAVISRDVPAFSVLIAGQSNAKGENVSAAVALAFISATPGVGMLGNDYVWKHAYEPTGDCVGHVDLVSADPFRCTSFDQNSSGVSPGVSLGNGIAAATGGDVFLIPAAKSGSSLSNWRPGSDRYDRSTLFGSAAYRSQLAGIERGAPFNSMLDGARYGLIMWYQGTSNTTSSTVGRFFSDTDAVLAPLQQELGAPVIVVQLHTRGPNPSLSSDQNEARNLRFQRAREVQRRMAEGAVTLAGGPADEARSNRYVVVAHDLPMWDFRHIDHVAQRELGRRISLAVRQHLLNEDIDGTGPRLLGVEKVSDTIVRVVFDRPITQPAVQTSAAYSGYFAVFADGEEVSLNRIRRDPDLASAVQITLSSPVNGDVDVRYMPPLELLDDIRLDVIRSASCSDPMPITLVCLPAPAFGDAMSSAEEEIYPLVAFDDDE